MECGKHGSSFCAGNGFGEAWERRGSKPAEAEHKIASTRAELEASFERELLVQGGQAASLLACVSLIFTQASWAIVNFLKGHF